MYRTQQLRNVSFFINYSLVEVTYPAEFHKDGVGGEEMLHSATFLRIVWDIRKILLETKKKYCSVGQ